MIASKVPGCSLMVGIDLTNFWTVHEAIIRQCMVEMDITEYHEEDQVQEHVERPPEQGVREDMRMESMFEDVEEAPIGNGGGGSRVIQIEMQQENSENHENVAASLDSSMLDSSQLLDASMLARGGRGETWVQEDVDLLVDEVFVAYNVVKGNLSVTLTTNMKADKWEEIGVKILR